MSIANIISKTSEKKEHAEDFPPFKNKYHSYSNRVLCTDALPAFSFCVTFLFFYVRASSSVSHSLLFLTSYVYLVM
jgi:hypothetical protein